MNKNYFIGLADQIDQVYKQIGTSRDPRKNYPWLTGALGDPDSGIWFISENPSKKQIERVKNPDGGLMTPEAQWWSSTGDQLFRTLLVKYGFKGGTISSPGGWNCYITNVIKEPDYAVQWHSRSQSERNKIAEIWSSVLSWELKHSKPKYVVIFGGNVKKLLDHLILMNMVLLPQYEIIKHYSYVGMRPEQAEDGNWLPAMDPKRLESYSKDFARIRETFNGL